MGKAAWDEKRCAVYASTDFHCAACGVHKRDALFHAWLEAHEIFRIDYAKGAATLIEIVPLCHACHAFIHSGLLRIRARKKEVSSDHVRQIMSHGCAVLRDGSGRIFSGTAELCDLVSVDRSRIPVMPKPRKMATWGAWRMVWDGVEHRGKFNSQREWQRAYA
jgi:hypothetical protein